MSGAKKMIAARGAEQLAVGTLWVAGIAIAIAWPSLAGSSYLVDVGTIALTYIVMGQALNLLFGFAGYLCLCVPVFWASGGFVAAHLVARDGMNALLSILIGGLAGAGVALLFGVVAMRGGRESFAVLSLVFLVFAVLVANSWSFTGGAQGIAGLPVIPIGPERWGLTIETDQDFYYGMLVITGLAVLVLFLLIRSRWGKTLQATNFDEQLAASFGVNLLRERLRAITLAGLFCGLAGAFYVFSLTIADPSQIAETNLTPLFAIVFLGGPGSFTGVTIAAILVAFLPQWTRDFQSDSNLVYGILLVLLCLIFPQGVPDTSKRYWHTYRRWATRRRAVSLDGSLQPDARESIS